MRYDFSKMNADSFELMVRSLNERIFGIRCEQYGLGPDGQREFIFEGVVKDQAGVVFAGRTIGQVKYKYITTKEDDYTWLAREIDEELQRFRQKETDYIPDNYLFYTNVVLTPAKDTGVKDKIEAYVREKNDIIKRFYVKGYDEICAMLDNNRDVAISYAATILPGDLLMKILEEYGLNYLDTLKRFLFCEFEEEMYPRLEQAGSVAEKKIPIEQVCVDINVTSRKWGKSVKFAEMVFELGNGILGYKSVDGADELKRDENFVLIGGPGKGKSTISQFIAQIYRAYSLQAMGYQSQVIDKFIKEFVSSYGYRIDRIRLPFKVALREYAAWIKRKEREENHSIMQYIKERIEKFEGNRLSTQTLRRMLGEQAWIFFFDGLDEVPESSNRQEVLKQIQRFITMELREAQCDCMIIGTTREQGYSNDFDEEKYMHMEVAELSVDDSHMYINKLFEVMEEQTERRKEYIRIMNEALEDEITGRLMKTPLQVTIIAILVKSGGKPPHERYSLFRQYYDTMIKREKQKGIVATLNDNTEWLEEIHYLVGHRLQSESEMEGNASAEISREELEKEIRNYVMKNQDDFYEVKNEEKENEFLMTITQRICFLNENREGFYSFTIRSMQEYFAGTYLIKGRSDKDALDNVRSIAYKSYWRNVLLFALGYIELERKSLETDIGILCEQMNGKDNIVREDYTSDNLCLFGSWLAVDILTEDIFRGKAQNKYIRLATEAIGLEECINYYKYGSITGTQKDKMIRYISDNYKENIDKAIKVVKLYLKLNENEKNDLTSEIANIMGMLTEEQVLALNIDIVKKGMQTDEVEKEAINWIRAALEQEKIKFFLPEQVLQRILSLTDKADSIDLKKNMLLQCLFLRHGRLDLVDLKEWLGLESNIEAMYRYLAPMYWDSYRDNKEIKLTESVRIYLCDKEIEKYDLMEIRTELLEMHLDYLAEFCEFLVNPTWVKYRILQEQIDKEDRYLAEKYNLVLQYYFKTEKISTEEKFRKVVLKRKRDYEEFLKKDLSVLCYQEIYINFTYYIGNNEHVFEKLMDNEKIPFEGLEKLNDEFFNIFLFVAGIQMIFKNDFGNDDDKIANGLIRVIYESNQRKKYGYQENIVIAVLIGSKYKRNLWEKVPDFLLTDEMQQAELIKPTRRNVIISGKMLEKIIGDIVSKLKYDAKENNYLSIIPTLINEPIDIKKCISENDMKELEQLKYSIDSNLLVIKLLRMCMSDNEMPNELFEDFCNCAVPREIIYLELEIMLRHCVVKNKEKLWVEMVLRLEKEDFEESSQIRKRVINDMMEARCNVVNK